MHRSVAVTASRTVSSGIGGRDDLGGDRVRLAQQAEHEVGRNDLVAPGGVRRVVGSHHGVLGTRREPAEVPIGVGIVDVARILRQEALAGRLFGDPHGPTDLGPRGTRASCLIDEVPDQVVGQFVEVVGGDDGGRELFQFIVVHLADRGDEIVETDRRRE